MPLNGLLHLQYNQHVLGHFHAHHQELETICVLLPPMVCSVLIAGCQGSDAGQQAMRPGSGMLYNCSHATSLFLDT